MNITEAVVDADDISSNPYSLSVGSKFFKLEAEPWRKDNLKDKSGSPVNELSHEGERPQKHRRASASDILTTKTSSVLPADSSKISEVMQSRPNVETSSSNDMVSSAFTLIEASLDEISVSPQLHTASTTPAPGPSSLSAQRPADLEPIFESRSITESEDLAPSAPETAFPATSVEESTPAFLPTSVVGARRIIRSATTPRATGGSLPRSYSSNDSHSLSSSFNKRMTSSTFLGNCSSPKGVATTSTSNSILDNEKSWSVPARHTQTIGRYVGKKNAVVGRETHASAAMVSQSSAADLLRSFTDAI